MALHVYIQENEWKDVFYLEMLRSFDVYDRKQKTDINTDLPSLEQLSVSHITTFTEMWLPLVSSLFPFEYKSSLLNILIMK